MQYKKYNFTGISLALGTLLFLAVGILRAGAQTACTLEARQCPDGSYVSRTGPNCEFTVCPRATSSGMMSPIAMPILRNASTSARKQSEGQAITNTISNANKEIIQRTNSLNALLNRVGQMQKVSSNEKDSLSATIQSQVTNLTNLKTQIENDSKSTSSLRNDVQSITKSYRIFMLVIPQGTITAAADRVMTIASTTAAVAAKLQTRISEVQTAGQNISALQTALSDINAKVADANAQAQAAINEIAPLTPDNGSSTEMQANTATLKDARSKIATAQKDLQAARQDAGTIVKELMAMSKSAASRTAASGTPQ